MNGNKSIGLRASVARRASDVLLQASSGADTLQRYFYSARTALMWGLIDDDALRRRMAATYGGNETYRLDSEWFDDAVFSWEERAFDRFFPTPPARILVGAAGGGRESLVLARRGYDVTAFDPADQLVAAFAERKPAELAIAVYRGAYEDLPELAPARPGDPRTDLRDEGGFDAAVMGWGSLSHIRTFERRVAALRAVAAVTRGPILTSFAMQSVQARLDDRPSPARRFLPARFNPERGTHFETKWGFFHYFSSAEVGRLAAAAGLYVWHQNDERSDEYGHAVFGPTPEPPSVSTP